MKVAYGALSFSEEKIKIKGTLSVSPSSKRGIMVVDNLIHCTTMVINFDFHITYMNIVKTTAATNQSVRTHLKYLALFFFFFQYRMIKQSINFTLMTLYYDEFYVRPVLLKEVPLE